MSPAFPVMRFTALTGALLGVGFVLLKATTAAAAGNEEEAYKRLSPVERQRIDEARALRTAQEAEIRAKVFAKAGHHRSQRPAEPHKNIPVVFLLFAPPPLFRPPGVRACRSRWIQMHTNPIGQMCQRNDLNARIALEPAKRRGGRQ
ncbi:hypothetical protein B0H13DRAFT_32283 [Mycena leptocephala]|nr:hypothetical protein B0H13DRAFT_32283 [Mycena leptocephala]